MSKTLHLIKNWHECMWIILRLERVNIYKQIYNQVNNKSEKLEYFDFIQFERMVLQTILTNWMTSV